MIPFLDTGGVVVAGNVDVLLGGIQKFLEFGLACDVGLFLSIALILEVFQPGRVGAFFVVEVRLQLVCQRRLRNQGVFAIILALETLFFVCLASIRGRLQSAREVRRQSMIEGKFVGAGAEAASRW